MKRLLLAAVFGAACMAAAPASAATVTLNASNLSCNLLTGCLFDGNDEEIGDIEAAYDLAHIEGPAPATLDLGVLVIKHDPVIPGGTSGSWTAPGLVEYVSVKAGSQFMLYKLAVPATSGTWSTAGLVNRHGDPHSISHLSLFGGVGVVPEPATWAMMISGFVGAGAMVRRQRKSTAVAA